MKKAVVLSIVVMFVGSLMAQTIVSTTPSNRNVILEEFTGVYCQYCPDGHRIANEIMVNNPNRAWTINIHTGGYAAKYFTQWGNALASQSGLGGFPTATINRHLFSGSATATGRGYWSNDANIILGMSSPVNVAAEGTIVGRTLTLHIEVYYTGNAANYTNRLNVAMLQNNVIGPQLGSDYNPTQVVGDQYRHMHMLRELLTGQWGISIPATQGSFFDTTIVYNIPQSIVGTEGNNSDTVEIGPRLTDLEFIVFVAENHQEILTGTKATITFEHPCMTDFAYERQNECSLSFQPYVTINNSTNKTITELVFTYDGQSIIINKVINPHSIDTVNMPIYTVVPNGNPVQNCAVTKNVSFVGYTGGGNCYGGSLGTLSQVLADFDIYTAPGPFTAIVGIDAYGSEASVALVNQSTCTNVWAEGPWTDLSLNSIYYISQIPDARYFTIEFDPYTPGLYVFRLVDSIGDGWSMTNDSSVAGLWLSNAGGEILSYPLGYSNGESFHAKNFYLNVTTNGTGTHVLITPDSATVAIESENENKGVVGGGGTYVVGSDITIWATASQGYYFDHWSDGDINNPRIINVSNDTTIIAYFNPLRYQVVVSSNDTTMGIVSGGGTFDYGTIQALVATPSAGCHFIHWMDGNQDNPRLVYVNEDKHYTAFFGVDTFSVSVTSNNISYGYVVGGGEFVYGSPCTVEATAYSGYRFLHWSNGSTYNPYSFAVMANTSLEAIFVSEGSVFNVITYAQPAVAGNVIGGGPYANGLMATIEAVPNEGWHFVHWNDDTTANPRSITVRSDTVFTAYFEPDNVEGIEAANMKDYKVYVYYSQIVIDGAEGNDVTVYDISGRALGSWNNVWSTIRYNTPVSGVYMIRIGNSPIRKVVVIR